jgi:hypothetical protein
MSLPGRKRNFTSPQKQQTSIVTFTAGGKKQNVNQTLERGPTTTSPLNRSFVAITGSPKPPPRISHVHDNNKFAALQDEDEEEELLDEESNSIYNDAAGSPEKTSSADPLELKNPLLSRKTIIALRSLRKAKNYLQDQSIIEEMEDVLGKGSYQLLTDIREEKSYPSAQEQKEGQDVAQDIGERSNEVSNDIGEPEEDSTEPEGRERGESTPNKHVVFAKGTIDIT